MAELSPAIEKKARKIQSLVLQALVTHSQVRVADLMGVDQSTVHRIREERLPQIAAFIAACGLKVVPQSANVYDEASIASLKHLAGIGLRVLHSQEDDE